MKRITYLFILFLLTTLQVTAQSFVVGTDNGTTTSTDSDPIDGYYNSFRYQTVYTAAELGATMTPYDAITALGFSIAGDYAGGDLLGYTIKIGHTTATNAAAHISAPTSVVKNAFNYNPTVTAAGAFDMITFDTPFVWNGVDNIVVEICTDGQNAYTAPYGQVRVTTAVTNGSRFYRTDGGTSCAVATTTTNNNRPVIQFNYTDGTPPACLGPSALGATPTSNSASLNWTPGGAENSWNIEWGVTGFTQGSGTVVSGVANPHPLGGLSPITTYQYYVQADCGGNGMSTWSGPFTFTTLCATVPAPTVLETFATYLPGCWSEQTGALTASSTLTGTTSAWAAEAGFGNTGSNAAVRINLYGGSAGTPDNDWLISNSIDLGATPDLYRVKYKIGATSYLGTTAQTTLASHMVRVVVSTDNGATWSTTNVIKTYTGAGSYTVGQDEIASLTGYTGVVKIGFLATTTGNTPDIDFHVDDFQVELIPACSSPTALGASTTSNSASLNWTPGGSENTWNIEWGVTGFAQGSGTVVNGVANPHPLGGLSPNTTYQYYVQADCGGSGTSTWTGPFSFTTACASVTDFTENFDGVTTPAFPSCWAKVGASGGAYTQTGSPNSAPNTLYLYGDSATNRAVVSLQPVSNLGAGTHRLKFNMRGNFSSGAIIEVGYLTNPSDATTFVALTTVTAGSLTYSQYVANIPAGTYTDFLAIRHTGNNGASVLIDDVSWEPIPAAAPGCATNVVATPDAACGNDDTVIVWDATANADGYRINMGTSTGATDVLNNVDLGNVTTYSYAGNLNATYYFTIVPYNVVGNATACTEQSFTTIATGCLCPSVPTSNDGAGISNVQVVSTDFSSGDVTYYDHSASVVDMFQGINNNVQITFVTGWAYDTNIWIDFNDNYTFETSEIVYQGTSLATNPTTLDASFVMPITAALGQHMMRIGTADTGQSTPNPCYSGSYGVTLDFAVNIVAASCSPVTATTTVTADCLGGFYFVDVDVTALGDTTTPYISDGIDIWPIAGTGITQVGPFATGSAVSLTAYHGTDATCDLSLGNFNYSCPPANDDCGTAIALTVGGVFADYPVVATNVAATGSNETAPGCASYSGGDVWYSAVVPASGSLTFENNGVSGGIYDSAGAVYSGSCGALVLVNCNDSSSSDPDDHPLITVTGRTPGEVLYYRVWEYFNDSFGEFAVSVYDASLSTGSFDNASFKAYPNPVTNVLNLSYSSDISNVEVFNMLGQSVMTKNVNATQGQVDMSNLASGSYIVKVTSEGLTKSIKVIKQ